MHNILKYIYYSSTFKKAKKRVILMCFHLGMQPHNQLQITKEVQISTSNVIIFNINMHLCN
jgi:hypothetical protein